MHPLAPNLKNISTDELSKKINDLRKRLTFAAKTNHYLVNQIFFLLDDYQQEYQKRLLEEQQKILKELGNDFFSDKIDVG